MKTIRLNIKEEPGAEAAKAAFEEMTRRMFHLDGPFFAMDFGGEGVVTLEVKPFGGKIRLSFIGVPEKSRGKGLASKALRFVTDIADKHGVLVSLTAHPTRNDDGSSGGMSLRQLKEWYKRHGFRSLPSFRGDSSEMEREPQSRTARIADRIAARLVPPPRMVEAIVPLVESFLAGDMRSRKVEKVRMDLRGWVFRGLVDGSGKRNEIARDFGALFVRMVPEVGRDNGDYANGILSLYLSPREDYSKEDVESIVEHELIHYAQEILDEATDGRAGVVPEEIGQRDVDQHLVETGEAGVIRRLREKGITPGMFHDLDDSEYYSELNSALRRIRSRLFSVDGEDRSGAVDAMTGVGSSRRGLEVDPFMALLKKKAVGKWKDAVGEIRRGVLVASERIATRPIRLDRAAARRSVGRLVRHLSGGYWGRHPEEPLREGIGFADKVTVTGVDGREFEVEVQYRSEYSPDNPDMVLGGGSGKTTKTKRPAVIVMLNGAWTPSVFTTTTSGQRFEDEVMEVLEHELTHQADSYLRFVGPTTQDRIKSEGELDLPEYYNRPHEVRGYMRSVFEEVARFLPKTLPHLTTREIMARLAFFSPIWKRIEPHLNDGNRRLILKGVYQAVEDWTAEQGAAKAARMQGGAE